MTPSELVESFAPFVLRTLKYHSVAERDLDDVCQEVFIIVFRRLPEFDSSRPKNGQAATGDDLAAAVDALLAGDQIPEADQVPSLGCNIKWKPGNEPV